MAEIRNFTQPDTAPDYFIDFLDFLDNHPSIRTFRSDVAGRLNLVPGNRVVDVGCGIGGATFPLAAISGPDGLTAGIDISTALIEVATRRANGHPGLEFRTGDACNIPYPDAFFDCARTERVFLYLPNRLAAIREMMRVVKPGGRVCLIDADVDSTAIYSTNPNLTRKMTSVFASTIPNPNSARELPALARVAGLRQIHTEFFALHTPYEFFVRATTGALHRAAESDAALLPDVNQFLAEQAAHHVSGDFLQIWLLVLVTGLV